MTSKGVGINSADEAGDGANAERLALGHPA
jgi:hypothetical protein